ncbi:MAG: GNAT family N-acetyltransferase [Anaerolineae bacterium]|nr:GNAT family N-acetyltransferase [Anaerolineae bacterium]
MVTLSLVADLAGKVVGHVFFSSVMSTAENEVVAASVLGPIAVSPVYQREGIGSELVQPDIEMLC